MTDAKTERRARLCKLFSYYHGSQYASLRADSPAVRSRRPTVVWPGPRLAVDSFVRGLLGTSRRPTFSYAPGGDDDLELEELARGLWTPARDAVRRALATGSGCVTWRRSNGALRFESWDPAAAAATFDADDELVSLDYRLELEPSRWHRELVTRDAWTVYADAADEEGPWAPSASVSHALGFVPAAWIRFGTRMANDGCSIYAGLEGLVDEASFLSSQLARATLVNLEPVIAVTNCATPLDLQKGTVWTLPQGADAKVVESSGSYVAAASSTIDGLTKAFLDAVGLVALDPKQVSGGQSGSALTLLLRPQIERLDELRSELEPALEKIVSQISGRSVRATWGAVVPSTPTDANVATQAAAAAVAALALSRESAMKYLSSYFGVEDAEVEMQKIAEESEADHKKTVELATSAPAWGDAALPEQPRE